MKAAIERSNKSNKRSQALIEILEKQGIEPILEDPIKRSIVISSPISI
jgi:hypothetical protein